MLAQGTGLAWELILWKWGPDAGWKPTIRAGETPATQGKHKGALPPGALRPCGNGRDTVAFCAAKQVLRRNDSERSFFLFG